MDREQKAKKKSVDELIEEAAEKGAQKVVLFQHMAQSVNHYRAMEDLLRAYPKRVRMMEHPEEFEFFRVDRSKDISIAPPAGSGIIDKIETAEMFTEARKRAYEYELFRLRETEYAIAPFIHLPEFIIIRMAYFGEDVHGNYRGVDAQPYTIEEIIDALRSVGIIWAERTVRYKRSKLVRAMTVMMFGVDGAISVESRIHSKINKKRSGEKHVAEMEEAEGQVCSEGR